MFVVDYWADRTLVYSRHCYDGVNAQHKNSHVVNLGGRIMYCQRIMSYALHYGSRKLKTDIICVGIKPISRFKHYSGRNRG